MSVSPRTRTVISSVMAYGPAAAWVAFGLFEYGRTWPVIGLIAMVAFGIFGLTGVILAWFPWTVERLGFTKLGAWLRSWWDQDAK